MSTSPIKELDCVIPRTYPLLSSPYSPNCKNDQCVGGSPASPMKYSKNEIGRGLTSEHVESPSNTTGPRCVSGGDNNL